MTEYCAIDNAFYFTFGILIGIILNTDYAQKNCTVATNKIFLAFYMIFDKLCDIYYYVYITKTNKQDTEQYIINIFKIKYDENNEKEYIQHIENDKEIRSEILLDEYTEYEISYYSCGKIYSLFIHTDNNRLFKFPIYEAEDIISSLQNKNISEKYIPYAGPKSNFYSDTEYYVLPSDIDYKNTNDITLTDIFCTDHTFKHYQKINLDI